MDALFTLLFQQGLLSFRGTLRSAILNPFTHGEDFMFSFYLTIASALISHAADKEVPPLPKPVTSFGAAVSDGFVYVYGGHSGKPHSYSTESTTGQFLRLSLANPAKWEELPAGSAAQGVALVAHGGKLYRIGGMQPRNKPAEKTDAISLASVSRYDPQTKKWEDLPALPAGRSSHDAVVVSDTIYVAGGWCMNGGDKDSDWHKTGVKLDLKKEPLKWEAFDQPFQRRALTMAAYDGKVCVIAGMTPEGSVVRTIDVYDPAKKAWSKIADIPGEGMNGFTPASVVLDGKLLVNPADGKIYRLNDKGAWDTAGEVKQARIVHRSVPISKNAILVLGGSAKGTIVGVIESIEVK